MRRQLAHSHLALAFGCVGWLLGSFAEAAEPIGVYTRSDYHRPDPNALLNGFFPAWAILMLCIAAVFLIISVVAYVSYVLGCRPPKGSFKKVPVRFA